MEFQLVNEAKIKCPCGKGYIVHRTFVCETGDIRMSNTIECEECDKKYNIETIAYRDGDHINRGLYLVRKDYPEYSVGTDMNQYKIDKVNSSIKLEFKLN